MVPQDQLTLECHFPERENVYVFFLISALIPPPNFGYVEPDLYRSAIPGEMNFSFLQTLRLKTVVYLSLDTPSQIFAEFLKEQGIEFRQIAGVEASSVAGQRISEQFVLDALHAILDPKCYPLMIMCNLGRHRTGTVIGCLRRLQKWSLSSIFDEFRRFTGSKSSPLHEQFIELFDTELVEMPEDANLLPFRIDMKTSQSKDQDAKSSDSSSKAIKLGAGRNASIPINLIPKTGTK